MARLETVVTVVVVRGGRMVVESWVRVTVTQAESATAERLPAGKRPM
jgi:hypothetical protein